MAFDEGLASRVRVALTSKDVRFDEKRMMGGLCFMVDGKMCVGIDGSRLMVRLDPAIYEESLLKPGCVPMDFTGRPMRGFVFVNSDGIASKQSLRSWIELALEFNPRARPSKSKPRSAKSQRSSSSRNKAPKPRKST